MRWKSPLEFRKQKFMTYPPKHIGPFGKAWRQNLEACQRKHDPSMRPHASVAIWLVYAPWANIAWHTYAFMLLHLRPLEALTPPIIYLPGATHEFSIFVLNPEPEILIDDPMMRHFCHPSNFAAQFIAENDKVAEARMVHSIKEVIQFGTLSPDTDYMQLWMRRYGDNMIKGDKSAAGQTKITITEGQGQVEIVIPPQQEPQPPAGN